MPARLFPLKELQNYLPDGSFDRIAALLAGRRLSLVISRKRGTRLGDFRPAVNGMPARISVNHNLNRYAFLVTLLHEMAHLVVWENAKGRPSPHGKEWKRAFREIALPFLQGSIFPEDIRKPLADYLENPSATSSSHLGLSRALSSYDKPDDTVLLSGLPQGSAFMLGNGKRFRKMERIRKNYRCLSLDNGRFYSVSPSAMVFPMGPGN